MTMHSPEAPFFPTETRSFLSASRGIDRRLRNRGAFTLVEMMIVVLIIGLLAGMVIPNFQSARQESQKNACINNLRVINAAKNIAAFDQGAPDGTTIPDATLDGYMNTGRLPECPAGGTYTYNPIGTSATCTQSAMGHVYPTP
jgi:prepilin-type N-terminal cleavage/methylation domain-containing protein